MKCTFKPKRSNMEYIGVHIQITVQDVSSILSVKKQLNKNFIFKIDPFL